MIPTICLCTDIIIHVSVNPIHLTRPRLAVILFNFFRAVSNKAKVVYSQLGCLPTVSPLLVRGHSLAPDQRCTIPLAFIRYTAAMVPYRTPVRALSRSCFVLPSFAFISIYASLISKTPFGPAYPSSRVLCVIISLIRDPIPHPSPPARAHHS